jgi:hypothetical protein
MTFKLKSLFVPVICLYGCFTCPEAVVDSNFQYKIEESQEKIPDLRAPALNPTRVTVKMDKKYLVDAAAVFKCLINNLDFYSFVEKFQTKTQLKTDDYCIAQTQDGIFFFAKYVSPGKVFPLTNELKYIRVEGAAAITTASQSFKDKGFVEFDGSTDNQRFKKMKPEFLRQAKRRMRDRFVEEGQACTFEAMEPLPALYLEEVSEELKYIVYKLPGTNIIRRDPVPPNEGEGSPT